MIDKNTKQPLANAQFIQNYTLTRSDANGSVSFDANLSKTVHIKAYGYRPYRWDVNSTAKGLEIEAIKIKGLYLSFWGASPKTETFKNTMELIESSEINTLVIDVKSEPGQMSYHTSVQEASAMDAHYYRTIKDIDSYMKKLKAKHVFTIARIVCFKDELSAANHPQRAVKEANGSVWRNDSKMAWVDPFNENAQDYIIDIAVDAAQKGFDEINFDYVRFPAKTDLIFSQVNIQENRVKAIDHFIKKASYRLRPYGVFLSVDTYGYVAWNDESDTNIGHRTEKLAEYADYLAPMLYPSGFNKGILGIDDPTKEPYRIIKATLLKMEESVEPVRLRPWLQYFKDYAFSGQHYNAHEIREQVR
ncbi:MAG: putative glycoside hydrolase, partial [Thiovulaceae bacterium]|nr:putative glycoside hydrolase [Sulfurimonadaceae bacterium]